MNAQLSSRQLEIVEARAKAVSRADMAAILGMSLDGIDAAVRRLGLPKFGRSMRWTEAEKIAIAQLRSQDVPFAAIAERFGTTSRAISGVINRLGLCVPRVKPRHVPKPRTRTTPKAMDFKCAPFNAREADIVPLHVSLLDLEPSQCRHPYGDGPFTFCGHPRADKSYCTAHMAINYYKPEARR